MKGININDKDYPFTDYILDGIKTIETRRTNSLKSVVGQRVGIIRTGRGKAMIVGYVDVARVKRYDTENEFRKDYTKHLVEKDSKYDISADGKYGYILENPQRCEPVAAPRGGIVIRNI